MLFGDFAESQLRDFNEEVLDNEFAENYGYSSDSDLGDDEGESLFSFEDATEPKAPSVDTLEVSGESKSACEHRKECLERGKIVKIPDMAFVT